VARTTLFVWDLQRGRPKGGERSIMRGCGLAFLIALAGVVSCGGVSVIKDSPESGTAGGASSGPFTGLGGSVVIGPTTSSSEEGIGNNYSRACILSRLPALPDGGDAGAENEDTDAAPDALSVEGPEGGLAIPPSTGPLTVLVIMDKSGSMSTNWDQRSRWQVANEAFSKAIEGVLDNLTIGAILFPQPDGCSVAPLSSGKQFAFEPGRSFAEHWQATLSTRAPQGSTPLGRAFQEADFHIEKACNDGLLDGRFRVIILTDGEPTCSEDPDLFTRLPREWRLLGIHTLVFGLPGSQSAADLLDAIAGSGGTSHYKAADTPGALDMGFYAAVR
jgi:hypothetical protein